MNCVSGNAGNVSCGCRSVASHQAALLLLLLLLPPRHLATDVITTSTQSTAAVSRDVTVMDASSSSPYLPAGGSTSRYAGVARYLASLEMAGSDLETPPGHVDTYAKPDDGRQATGAAAKPEMNGDDVTPGSDTSPASRRHQQVAL